MRKIAIILLVLITAPLSLAYYYWHQATRLPEWYTANQTFDAQESNSTEQLTITVPQEMPEEDTKAINNGKSVEVKLDEKKLNDLVTAKISKEIAGSELSQAVKDSNTTIRNGKIESGAVVSLSDIPVDQLQENEKEALERVVKTFPTLKDKEVYVSIEGKPRAENGQLAFDDSTNIKLGNLSFTVAELSTRLGVPKESVEEAIKLELKELEVK